MKIQTGKTYLTAGEYVVEIMGYGNQLHATRRTSAGECGGKGIDKCWNKPYGWYYNDDGSITGISKEWDKKLTITEELPFSLPELPKRYEWAGGFPQYRVPNVGECFCTKNINGTLTGEVGECFGIAGLLGSDKRRLIVSKAALTEPKSESPVEPSVVSEKPPKVVYYKPSFKDNALFIKRVGNKLGFVYANDLNPNFRYFWGASDEREVREGRWVEITQEDVDKILAALSEPQRSESPVESSVVPKELPPLPILNSSDGYKFLLSNGEPVFRKPNDGEYFVKYHYITKTYGPIVKSKNFSVPWGADERRYIVVPTTPEKTSERSNTSGAPKEPQEPEDWVEITDLDHVDRADIDQWSKDGFHWIQTIDITDKMSLRKCRERFGENAKYRCLRKHQVVPLEQPIGTAIASYTVRFLTKGKSYDVYEQKIDRILIKDNSGEKNWHVNNAFDTVLIGAVPTAPKESFESDISLSDNIVSGADSTKEEEEIIMKKETAIKVANSVTRFAGRWGFKAANYWLFEPAVSMGRPIVKSVRYAVFLGTLGSAIYGYNHPEVVKNAIKSCIPKITIEAPEILNG